MKDNEKKEDGIEEVVSQFEEASGEDDDEVLVCKLSDEAMQFVNQFPIEGRDLILAGFQYGVMYGSHGKEPNISDLMAGILITYGQEVVPQIAKDAGIEGERFFVYDNKHYLENQIRDQKGKISVIALDTKDPYGLTELDSEYRYFILIIPDYNTPHEQSTENFQYPGNLLPFLFRTKDLTSDSVKINDIESFDLFDKTGWISIREVDEMVEKEKQQQKAEGRAEEKD